MNKSKKALAQYLKLNYGLRYNKNGSFILSDKPISEGELKLEKYTDQILIYEPIQNNPWDLFADEFTIKNDDNSLEFETLLDKMSLLAKTDIKLLIPTLKITYFGELIADVGSSIDRENYQEFLPREVLVGGFLIIRNAITYNPLEFDRLKAHISWSINEARWKWNLSKPEIMDSEFKNIEDSNGNPIRDMKTLTDYLNQLYKFETATVIAYEKVVPVEQKKNDSSFDIRLIPGITNHHKETAMKCWIQDNIHLNLPFWTKEYQLNHGVVVTSYGLMAGTKPVLDFLSVSSIKWEKNTRLKISTIRNEFMYDEIYNNETNVEEINTDEIKKKLSDAASTNVIQCNIFRGEVVITIWEEQVKQISKPSQQLVKDINDALNDKYPYKSLAKVFSEYGHMICTEIIMGRSLECIEWSEWSDTIKSKCKDLLKKFNMNDQNLITHNKSDKNLNEINTWSLADRTKLVPLYEIFDEKTKSQIQNLLKLENKQGILMTGVTKLNSSTRYYRVNFNNYLLTSDDYQVIGSVIVNNKRLENLSVKFQMKSISGFSIIIKEHKNEEVNGDLEVVWQLIGKPKSVGYFSIHTRNIKVFNKKFEVEISKQENFLPIDVEELSPNFIIATSIQYPPTNYESTLQVAVKSWSGKTINLDIKYHMDASDDNTEEDESDQPDKASVQLYIINPDQQESVSADFGSGQVLWKSIGHELGSDIDIENNEAKSFDVSTPLISQQSPNSANPIIPIPNIKEVQESPNLRTPLSNISLGKFTPSIEVSGLIKSVFTTIGEIVPKQYDSVKAECNEKTCLIFVERVEMIELSVKDLTRRREENSEKFQREDYYHSFIELEKVLKLVKTFIWNISELKRYREFILASDFKKEANQLLDKLEVCCNDLQFSKTKITLEIKRRERQSLDEDIANMTKFLKPIESESSITRAEGVSLLSQLLDYSQTTFNAPTIDPKELHDTEETVTNTPTNSSNLVKNLNIINNSSREAKRIEAELSKLSSIPPSNKIIEFHGTSILYDHTVDQAEHGNLKGLYEKERLKWIDKLKIAHDIAKGLKYLHARKNFHHDIRCENILITRNAQSQYEAKITEFQKHREKSNQIQTDNTIIRWLAPEIMPKDQKPSNESYTFKCEIFSFGMLLWELGARKYPYKDKNTEEIITHVMSKQRETFEDFNTLHNENDNESSIVKGFIRIIKSAWEHEPNQRPIINVMYQELETLMEFHPFSKYPSKPFSDVNFEKDDSNLIEL